MNKKITTISILFAVFFIMILSGCDWCGCCKKDSCATQTIEKKKNSTPEHTDVMPTHAEEPEAIHSVAPHVAPMPIHEVEPKAVSPIQPVEPKIAPIMPAARAPKVA